MRRVELNITRAYESGAVERKIRINRAPVLILWAAVAAERLGFDRYEALSLAKAVAGLNAQSKGRRLGIFQPKPAAVREARKRRRGEEFWVDLLGRHVPAINTVDGVRAVIGAKAIEPEGVQSFLEGKFGDDLVAARAAIGPDPGDGGQVNAPSAAKSRPFRPITRVHPGRPESESNCKSTSPIAPEAKDCFPDTNCVFGL